MPDTHLPEESLAATGAGQARSGATVVVAEVAPGHGVPGYRLADYRPRPRGEALPSDAVLVIPVLNEGARIQAQLAALQASGVADRVDVVIADGGSTDGSLDDALLVRLGVRAKLVKTSPGKQGAQFRMALRWALDEGYRVFVTMDGNGKDGVDGVLRIADKVREGFDYVQGSRYAPGGRAINTPLDRKVMGRLVHAPICSLSARVWLTDTTNGFRGYSRALLEGPLDLFRDVFSGYEFLFYISARAARFGARVVEVPVTRAYPSEGPTPTKMTKLSAKLRVLLELLKAAAGHYDPASGREGIAAATALLEEREIVGRSGDFAGISATHILPGKERGVDTCRHRSET